MSIATDYYAKLIQNHSATSQAKDLALHYNFSGKTALITGAGSGFGAATAKRIAASGGRVIGVDRNRATLEGVLRELSPIANGAHHAIVADLLSPEAIKAVVEESYRVGQHIDILINSAGICHFDKMAEITTARWDEVFEIDVRSLFFLSVAVAEKVNPERGARIINLGSNAGRKGRVLSAHYAAAKAAVANVTESLALGYGPKNVTVNTVCPAVVLTPLWDSSLEEFCNITGKSAEELVETWRTLTPLRRLGTVEDVTNLIVFLASDEAAFLTGQQINICGGFMLTC
jgi:meso-butanediol dehydrogenase/(S,S)-butanediol dehydrogenase/diacetyl reductase